MMERTKALWGDWAMIQEALGDSFRTLRGASEATLVNAWKQAGLKAATTVFLDPDVSKPPKGLTPRKGRHLAWTKRPSKAWQDWCKKHAVELEALEAFTPAVVAQILASGQGGVRFTPEAAHWFAEVTDGSYAAMANGLEMLAFLPQPIEVSTLAATWDRPSLFMAHQISRHLGTQRGLELGEQVPEEDAYKLLNHYFVKSLREGKPEWQHALHVIRWAVSRRRLDPWLAVQIFVLYTYQEAQWPSSSRGSSSSSPPRSTPLRALYRACGTPFDPFGAPPTERWFKPGLRLLTSPGNRGS